MNQNVNFHISVKTELSIEEFLKLFSNVEWIETYRYKGFHMKNNYGYFSINGDPNNEFPGVSFYVNGYINKEDFHLLLKDLNQINAGYWVDLVDNDNNLIDTRSRNF